MHTRFAYSLAAVLFFAAPPSQAGLPSHKDLTKALQPRPAIDPRIAAAAEFEQWRKWDESIARPSRPVIKLRYAPTHPMGDGWEFPAVGHGGGSRAPKTARPLEDVRKLNPSVGGLTYPQ